MPIYRQCNEFEESKVGTGDLFYAAGDFRKCSETVFVHLGIGDVSIETGSSRSELMDELFFIQSPNQGEIGAYNNDAIGKPTCPPVRIVFDKIESVDVVIDALKKIRKALKS